MHSTAASAAYTIGLVTLLILGHASRVGAQTPGNTFINPPGLVTPTGYTHVVVAGDRRTVYRATLVRPELLLEIEGVAVLREPLRP